MTLNCQLNAYWGHKIQIFAKILYSQISFSSTLIQMRTESQSTVLLKDGHTVRSLVSAAVSWLFYETRDQTLFSESLWIVSTLRLWREGLFIKVEKKLVFQYDIFAKIWSL